jgi:hypothetical protein
LFVAVTAWPSPDEPPLAADADQAAGPAAHAAAAAHALGEHADRGRAEGLDQAVVQHVDLAAVAAARAGTAQGRDTARPAGRAAAAADALGQDAVGHVAVRDDPVVIGHIDRAADPRRVGAAREGADAAGRAARTGQAADALGQDAVRARAEGFQRAVVDHVHRAARSAAAAGAPRADQARAVAAVAARAARALHEQGRGLVPLGRDRGVVGQVGRAAGPAVPARAALAVGPVPVAAVAARAGVALNLNAHRVVAGRRDAAADRQIDRAAVAARPAVAAETAGMRRDQETVAAVAAVAAVGRDADRRAADLVEGPADRRTDRPAVVAAGAIGAVSRQGGPVADSAAVGVHDIVARRGRQGGQDAGADRAGRQDPAQSLEQLARGGFQPHGLGAALHVDEGDDVQFGRRRRIGRQHGQGRQGVMQAQQQLGRQGAGRSERRGQQVGDRVLGGQQFRGRGAETLAQGGGDAVDREPRAPSVRPAAPAPRRTAPGGPRARIPPRRPSPRQPTAYS